MAALDKEVELENVAKQVIGGTKFQNEARVARNEEIYPEPSLLGSTPRENAHIRTLARIGDLYLINTAFTLASLTRTFAAETAEPAGIESIVALLSGQLASSIRTLDRMIGRDGFACLGRLTPADCALAPALSFVQNMLLNRGLADPIAATANVAAYQAAIQGQKPAARVLAEFRRGREERRAEGPQPQSVDGAGVAAMTSSMSLCSRRLWSLLLAREVNGPRASTQAVFSRREMPHSLPEGARIPARSMHQVGTRQQNVALR